MEGFERLERLRAAESATAYAADHTLEFPTDLSTYHLFITSRKSGILAEANKLWPKKLPNHWSEKTLRNRAKTLGAPFEEVYESLYKQLSWQVHSGLEGSVNRSPEWFPHLYGVCCQIAALSYDVIVRAAIIEFKLSSAIPTINQELVFAKLRAGTKDLNEEAALRRGLGLDL